jgi:hypothetical protein
MLKIYFATLDKIFDDVAKYFTMYKWVNEKWMNFWMKKS